MKILLWIAFVIFVLAMLALDLGVLRRRARLLSTAEAMRWTMICIALALGFNVLIYLLYEYRWMGISSDLGGLEAAKQYFTAWLVEQSLSLDNVFVFAIIFSYFNIPTKLQHRVLFWGVVGALIMRGVMIALGAALLQQFTWTEYLFGALLLYAAIKMAFVSQESFHPERNLFFRIAQRIYPVSAHLDGERFFTMRADGKRCMTPLFLVLLIIESSDVLFAVDSIPAVFAVTSDPFIVFTSNIFAILNLRSLYFALSSLMGKFDKLRISLVAVLIFVSLKMMLKHHVEIATTWSMVVICVLIGFGIVASVVGKAKREG